LFPRTKWVYLPHSLTVSAEIEGYRLPPVLDQATRLVYRRLQRWALRNADCTLRFTRMGTEVLRLEYPAAARHATFFVNPIGLDVPPSAKRRRAGPLRLLSVGQLIHRKRLDLAISALLPLRGRNWHYTIVGDGDARGALEELVRHNGLSGQVTFAGFSASPEQWYGDADVLLFPSQSESLGLVLLEAMSHGTPAIAFRNAASQFKTVNEELIDHDSTGWLVDPPDGLRAKVEALLDNPDQICAVGNRAYEHVIRQFTWGAHLKRYANLFETLLSGAEILR
jgi:glycosyltransferase involved in cell wall biosynthesis